MNEIRPLAANKADRPHAFPLAFAGKGEHVRISSLRAGKGLSHRLMDLGLPLGTVIRIVQRSGGGAMVVERDTLRIALGAGLAQKVMVTLAEGAEAAAPEDVMEAVR